MIFRNARMMVFLSVVAIGIGEASAADWTFLPEPHHQRYQTYGLFIENQSTLLYESGERGWMALGATIALFEKSDLPSKPQLSFDASVNTAFRFEDGLSPETADARVALRWETMLSEAWLLSAGLSHASGHMNDSALDPGLGPLNVGVDSIPVRVIYQGSPYFRGGATLISIFGSDPATKLLQGNQFFEIFPWGPSPNEKGATPYLALGVEEIGYLKYRYSGHVQLGVYYGNHLEAKRSTSMRVCVGAYDGPDLRLKYAFYTNSTMKFVYAGLMFDL